jgi:hypothetical protein
MLTNGRGEFTDGSRFWKSDWSVSRMVAEWLNGGATLVGHNISFDLGVLCENDHDLFEPVFRALAENRITDTMWRQKLADIGRGSYRGFFRGPVWIPLKYNLGDVAKRHGGAADKSDPWRFRYSFLAEVPLREWPAFVLRDLATELDAPTQVGTPLVLRGADALSYALGDPVATLDAFVGQATRYAPELLVDEWAQARKFWALHLAHCWGLRTSLKGVLELERGAREEQQALLAELSSLDARDDERAYWAERGYVYSDAQALEMFPPLVRPEWILCWRCKGNGCATCAGQGSRENPDAGKRDTKAAKARMLWACMVGNQTVRRTNPSKKLPEGDVCLDSDACESSGDRLLEWYSEYSKMSKVLSNDVEALRLGVVWPIQTRWDLCDTGRVSSSKPNVMNPRRLAGVRECYVPRNYREA